MLTLSFSSEWRVSLWDVFFCWWKQFIMADLLCAQVLRCCKLNSLMSTAEPFRSRHKVYIDKCLRQVVFVLWIWNPCHKFLSSIWSQVILSKEVKLICFISCTDILVSFYSRWSGCGRQAVVFDLAYLVRVHSGSSQRRTSDKTVFSLLKETDPSGRTRLMPI